ncbi:hypothetical protein FLA_4684 [Filimonas lacunae]|nr:hypothetical protein FLA_4684 [Filimonas lacunae]
MLLPFLLGVTLASAQKKIPKFKFGDVKPEDFAATAYAVDSSADAVYLFDVGYASFEGNNDGFFNVVFKHHVRIHLLHKNAFDLATVELSLFGRNEDAQKIAGLEVATYNLEGGKVVTTRLEKGSLFKDKGAESQTQKFTFPAIKEGSIIEYTYEITTPDARRIPTWRYQDEYPRLWCQYEVSIPELFDFVFVKQGYCPYAIDTAMVNYSSFHITAPGATPSSPSRNFTWSGNIVTSVWAMKDVPALKSEAYTTTLRNHVAKIEFQLSAIRYPNEPVKHVMNTWNEAAEKMLKSEMFGEGLSDRSGWMDDELKLVAPQSDKSLDVARKIYENIRDHYTCTDDYDIYRSQSLKKTCQSKKGNVADINLLLTAMYRSRGFTADPVILSTRERGKVLDAYPIMNKFNYAICRVQVEDQFYLLDATQPNMGFGKLPLQCYNGSGRIISEEPYVVQLDADSLRESSLTTVFIVNEEKEGLSGSFVSSKGYNGSTVIRSNLKKIKEDEFFNNIKKGFSLDVDMANSGIDSLKVLEEPVSYHYDFKFSLNDESLVYFSPVIGDDLYKENPFKAAERLYPVEMPYCRDETYVLNMEMPKGYKVEELPKSARVNLNENEGKFEFIAVASEDRIQLRSRLVLNKATFWPDDYQTLRDFFTYIVKKQNEKIVFKKVN